MKAFWLAILVVGPTALAGAMGFTEDPQERLTKTWDLDPVKTLEVRGQIDFKVVPGPKAKVTVEASRALFDQLTVSNWWGSATVAIETGLQGPRERGKVTATIELPSLQELRVLDQSSGLGTWPGATGTIRAEDHSDVEMVVHGTRFTTEVSWLAKVSLEGQVETLGVNERHQSHVDTTGLAAAAVDLYLDEDSVYDAGTTGHGSGTARHGSQVFTRTDAPWADLILKEDSVRKPRTESSLP